MAEPVSMSVDSSQFAEIDWSTHSLDVGIMRGDNIERWLPFDRTDMELLIQLLTRPVIPGVLPAAEASAQLARFVEWLKAAKNFADEKGLP